MNAADTVKDFMVALEAKDFAGAASYLSDGFVISGWTPQPLDKGQFITVMEGLKEGLPNLSYHFNTVRDIRDLEQESSVKAAVQITGTQTDGFILPPLGLPPIPSDSKNCVAARGALELYVGEWQDCQDICSTCAWRRHLGIASTIGD